MKLVGLMLCRNSDWVIGLSLRAALMWCDAVVVLLHNCTDETEELVGRIANETDEDLGVQQLGSFGPMHFYNRRVLVDYERSEHWREMQYRQMMLNWARRQGATHIAMIDDDEVLSGHLLPTIRETVENLFSGTILMLPWLQLRGGISEVMNTGIWSRSQVSVAFKDEPYWHWAGQGAEQYDFHHRHPMGAAFFPAESSITSRDSGLMHLQFCSERRLKAKQYLYQLVERKRWPNRKSAGEVAAYYSQTVQEAEAARVGPVPESWWAPYQHLVSHLHIDTEPWQMAECRRLIAENPGIEVGLNSFGLEL